MIRQGTYRPLSRESGFLTYWIFNILFPSLCLYGND